MMLSSWMERHCLPLAKEYVLSKFRATFEGIGKLPGGKYHIQLKPDAQPVQHPPRAVPEKKKAAYKEELERLCSSGIIEPVQRHTDWISSVITFSKLDASIWLCLDPKDLNKSIKRNQYYTKTINEVSAELHGGKYFTLVSSSSLKQPSAISSDRPSRQRVWRSTTKRLRPSNSSQTSRNDLEEEYCHCLPETSTTSSEACKIRNLSWVHLWEGQLNCRRP